MTYQSNVDYPDLDIPNFSSNSTLAEVPCKVELENPSRYSSPRLPSASRTKFTKLVAFRKRPPVYKNWIRIGVFDTAKDAEKTQANFEGFHWARRQRRETKDGLNMYFRCRGSPSCPVFVYLRYQNTSPQVLMYRTQNEHSHGSTASSSSGNNSSSSIWPSTQDLEKVCYTNWKRRSSEIAEELKTRYGYKNVNMEVLRLVLKRIRHQFGDDGWNTDDNSAEETVPSTSTSGSRTTHQRLYPPQLVNPVLHNASDDDDVVILPPDNKSNFSNRNTSNTGCPDEEEEMEIHPHCIIQDSTLSDIVFVRKQVSEEPETTVSDPVPQITSVRGACSQSKDKIGGENLFPKPKFSCRDESKEQGEICLPDEDNIKGAVLKYIDENYSNRDILHIREELRTLRQEKKYPAMNRLFSFTAGFLQDSFLGHHLEENK